MRDVGERPAVDESRIIFKRLHQIGLQRVLQQHRHRAMHAQILRQHRFLIACVADHDVAEPRFQVFE